MNLTNNSESIWDDMEINLYNETKKFRLINNPIKGKLPRSINNFQRGDPIYGYYDWLF